MRLENQGIAMINTSIRTVLLLATGLFSQIPPIGDFYYIISPRQTTKGQDVRFEAREFTPCQRQFTTTYQIEPVPMNSKPTFILKLNAVAGEQCAPAYGYNGPIVTFNNLDVGLYKIEFDSTSQFQKDLGDTNFFEITVATEALNKKERSKTSGGKQPMNENKWMRIDGKVLGNHSPFPPVVIFNWTK